MKPDLGQFPRHVRRAVMLGAIRSALYVSGNLSTSAAQSFGSTLGDLARFVLRSRLKTNMTLALGNGNVPVDGVDEYFHHLGKSYGWAMATYHRGFRQSSVSEHFEFDPSVAHLDRAVARGKGVILLMPHQFCEELAGAFINGRHKVVYLIREQQDPARAAIKSHWYRATGMDVIPRPRRPTLTGDMFACVNVLKSGRILVMAPDVIVSHTSGVPVKLFGREVHLSPGFLVLSMKQDASVLTGYIYWKTRDRLTLKFTEPIEYPRSKNQRTVMSDVLQSWSHHFEQYLIENPQNWRFWLDKRWTRTFRSPDQRTWLR
jgi:KDO2-lipid IV(A) lauroyltransferase